MRLVPITLTAARRLADEWHSHLDRPQGAMFASGVEVGRIVCVAIFGHPTAPALQGRAGEVVRVASDGSTRHAASMAIGAVSRAATALGWRRIVSYTLLGEAGACLRAAGYHVAALSDGGEHDRRGRPRAPAQQPGAKVRWEFGHDAAPLDAEADALVRASVGRIEIPPRRVQGPLFRRDTG